MRKLSTIFPLLLSLTLVSCTGKAPSTGGENNNTTPTPIKPTPEVSYTIPKEEIKATKPRKVVFSLKDNFDPKTGKHADLYQEQVWEGAKKAGKDFGVKVELLPNPCHTCVEDQIRSLAKLIDGGGVDGIVIMVTDSIRLARVIERAVAKGIPVVAMDTPVNSDQILTFVVFDNFAGGRVMGEWVAKKLGGKGGVLLLDGALEQQNAVDRKDGFLAGLKTGNIEILDTKSAKWSEQEAKTITEQWLKQFPKIDAIIAANYAMALGASEAVTKANRQDQILITGFDAMKPAIEAIKEKKIAATIDQTPDLQARISLQLLLRHLEKGETYPSRVVLPEIPLINQENIQQYSQP